MFRSTIELCRPLFPTVLCWREWGFCWMFLLAGAIGCGSGQSPAPGNTAGNEPAAPAAGDAGQTAGSGNAGGTSGSGTSNSGRKYVDGIPYDVFYDQPLSIAAENQTVANAPQTASPSMSMSGGGMASPAPTETTQPTPTPTPAPAKSAAGDWSQVVPKEILLAEVTRIRNNLSANLQSVGNFNRELLTIQGDAAVLASLAGIATQHDAEFTWKPNAKFVRDFSYTIAIAAEERGRPAFETASAPFLNIVEILDGGTPAALPEAEETVPFSDIAERNMLMKQMGSNADWLRTTISNAGELKSKKNDVIAKATILAMIGSVIKDEGYVFADEEDYQSFCQELIDGGLQIVNAAQNDSYDEFKSGLDLVNKSCNNCHPQYLNN